MKNYSVEEKHLFVIFGKTKENIEWKREKREKTIKIQRPFYYNKSATCVYYMFRVYAFVYTDKYLKIEYLIKNYKNFIVPFLG